MATAAVVLQIPVAHIHGGELTLGAMDDSLRHAITKLSYLHFATTDEHAGQAGQAPAARRQVVVVDAKASVVVFVDD